MNYLYFVIFAVLATLKLAHVVDWSWWIITLPITAPLGISLFLFAIAGIAFAAAAKSVDVGSLYKKFGQ